MLEVRPASQRTVIKAQVDGDAVEIGCTVVQALVLVRHIEVVLSTVSVRVVQLYPLRCAVYTTFIYVSCLWSDWQKYDDTMNTIRITQNYQRAKWSIVSCGHKTSNNYIITNIILRRLYIKLYYTWFLVFDCTLNIYIWFWFWFWLVLVATRYFCNALL